MRGFSLKIRDNFMEKVEKKALSQNIFFFSTHGTAVEMFDALSLLLHTTISLYSRAALYYR